LAQSAWQALHQLGGDHQHRGVTVTSTPLVGGQAWREQIQTVQQGKAHVVVGTPGRILDCIHRQALSLLHVHLFALDECDELIAEGMEEHVLSIFQHLSPSVQVCAFSSTLPPSVQELTRRIMRTPIVRVSVSKEPLSLDGIKHVRQTNTSHN
jgi:superfamily II DNA/RNA helicase